MKQFKNSVKYALLLMVIFTSISGCKKEVEQSAPSLKAPKKISLARPPANTIAKTSLSTALDNSTWDSFETYQYYPEELDFNSNGGYVDFPKICDWVVARQSIGLWTVTSHEVVTLSNKKPIPTNYTYKITGITHTGSDIQGSIFTSWQEASATPAFGATYAAMRVTGNVSNFGIQRYISGWKPFTIPALGL